VAQDAVAARETLRARALRRPAVDERGEVELELVPIASRVRTLHLAELALEAGVHDGRGLRRADPAHVTLVARVDQREERRERVAVFEAEAAAVADLERAPHVAVERVRVPLLRLRRAVGRP